MSAHTPGPLEVGYYRPSDAFREVREHIAVMKPNGALVALTGPAAGSKAEQSQADAYLYAAAPELLKALETMRRALNEMATYIDDEMDLDRDDKPNWAMRLGTQFGGLIGNALNSADAAIAKARNGGGK